MTVAFRALCVCLVVVTCVHLREAQTVSDRCLCPITSSKFYKWDSIKEFTVTQPKSHCKSVEIILTLTDAETGEDIERCQNIKMKRAKILMQCWNRKNKDGSKEKMKISEC